MDLDEKSPSRPSNQPSLRISGWHWLIVIGTLIGTVLEGLIPHSFGTLIASFRSKNLNNQNDFVKNATQFQLNLLPATSSAIPCILLPIFAIIVQRLNKSYQLISLTGFVLLSVSCGLSSLVLRWDLLIVTYSILYSIGCSLFLAIVVVISAEYFPVDHRYHVLATSFYQIGYPIASVIGNPVLAILILEYGWRNALKFAAIIELIGGAFISSFMKPKDNKGCCSCSDISSEEKLLVEGNTETSNAKASSTSSLSYFASTFQMWPWLIGKYINYTCWYGLRTNIVTYLVKSTTFGLTKSATLMSTYAAAEIVVAVTASMIGDKLRGYLIHIHILSSIVLALLTGIYTLVLWSYLSAILLMIGIGMFIQLSLSFGYPASVEVWNSELDMKTCWILTNVAAGLGIITSPLYSGILMDKFGVEYLFYAQCFGWILQAFLFFLTLLLVKSSKSTSTLQME